MSLPEHEGGGAFQPYSFLGAGGRGPRGVGDSLGTSIEADAAAVTAGGGSLTGDSLRAIHTGPSSPPAARRTPAARTPGGTIPHESEHAEFLGDKLEYLVPPTINAVERETPMNSKTVFMGHMRFETTAAEVRWIIRRLCNVTALKVEVRAKGCFLVHLATDQDEAAVRTLHRRILMDHHGMWIARTPQEASILNDYVEQVLCRGPKRRLRLPKDCVTVETPHSGHSTPIAPPPMQDQQMAPRGGSAMGSSGNRSPMHYSSYGTAAAPVGIPPPPSYGYPAPQQQSTSPNFRPPPPSYIASNSTSVVVGHYGSGYPPYNHSDGSAHPYTGSPVQPNPPPPPYGYSGY